MAETDSKVALTCCQEVSAVERKIEAGNGPFSLKILQKREMRKSTTQGDIMEWTCFVPVFPKCCNKCCGLTNCLKQKPRGLLQQIKSSISTTGRGGARFQCWQSYSGKAIIILVYQKEWPGGVWCTFWVQKGFYGLGKYLRNVWNNS